MKIGRIIRIITRTIAIVGALCMIYFAIGILQGKYMLHSFISQVAILTIVYIINAVIMLINDTVTAVKEERKIKI